MISPPARAPFNRLVLAGIAGFGVGLPGGLIGLGGAEFRLPLLIGVFGFPALEAVIVNKATSLIVVASGLVSRSQSIPFDAVMAQWPTIATLRRRTRELRAHPIPPSDGGPQKTGAKCALRLSIRGRHVLSSDHAMHAEP